MKKIFLYILAGSLCFSACKRDDAIDTYVEPDDINVQNNYDEQAINKFMDENYLDAQGNIKAFSTTDTSDDNEKKLSELKPVKLPSGTIYIMREGAQPTTNPQPITDQSVIKIMGRGYAYLAAESNGSILFTAKTAFMNTIDGSTIPVIDPMYYYVKQATLDKGTSDAAKQRSYYEIAGLKEALQKFSSFNNLPSETPYNLQGVIIVPSKAAFARNAHYPYLGQTYRNMSFVFNFQMYGSRARLDSEK